MDGIDHGALLRKVSRILGGDGELCRYLGVPEPSLEVWLQDVCIPTPAYVKLVDVLLAHCGSLQRGAQDLAKRSTRTRLAAGAALHSALQARVGSVLQRGKVVRPLQLLECERSPADPGRVLAAALDVLAEAHVMAVVSSPIVDARSRVRGMISTHYAEAGARSADEVSTLAAIARRTGALLPQHGAV